MPGFLCGLKLKWKRCSKVKQHNNTNKHQELTTILQKEQCAQITSSRHVFAYVSVNFSCTVQCLYLHYILFFSFGCFFKKKKKQWMKMESESNMYSYTFTGVNKKREKKEKSDYLIRFLLLFLQYYYVAIIMLLVVVVISLMLYCSKQKHIYRSTMWLVMRNLLASHHHRHQNQNPIALVLSHVSSSSSFSILSYWNCC